MIDLCNKKNPVYAIPWKKLKSLADISQNSMTCAVNGSEKSALGPRELCKTPHAAEQDGFFFFH